LILSDYVAASFSFDTLLLDGWSSVSTLTLASNQFA
jgi:hypothetical protein